MHNACWARKSASGHTCAWSAAGWRRRAQKPVAARRSHTGAPRRAQALRVRVRCTRGVSHDRPVVSGWPDAAKRGFPVLAVMPRVASRIAGARLGCAVPLTGSARKRHDQRWARHERDAVPTRTRRPGATPACLGGGERLQVPWRWSVICVSVFPAKNHLVPQNILRNGVVFKKVGEEIAFFNNVLAESQW